MACRANFPDKRAGQNKRFLVGETHCLSRQHACKGGGKAHASALRGNNHIGFRHGGHFRVCPLARADLELPGQPGGKLVGNFRALHGNVARFEFFGLFGHFAHISAASQADYLKSAFLLPRNVENTSAD